MSDSTNNLHRTLDIAPSHGPLLLRSPNLRKQLIWCQIMASSSLFTEFNFPFVLSPLHQHKQWITDTTTIALWSLVSCLILLLSKCPIDRPPSKRKYQYYACDLYNLIGIITTKSRELSKHGSSLFALPPGKRKTRKKMLSGRMFEKNATSIINQITYDTHTYTCMANKEI